MTLHNIRHTGIVVKNIKKSLYFYKNLLGFKIQKRMMEEGLVTDKLSNLKKTKIETFKMVVGEKKHMIELLYFHSHKRKTFDKNYNISRIGISHFAVTVKNVDSLYKKLKKNGIMFVSEPTLSNDKKVKLTFCRAPEGTLIEMVQVL